MLCDGKKLELIKDSARNCITFLIEICKINIAWEV